MAVSAAKTEGKRFFSDVIWVGISQTFVMAFGIMTMPALTKSYSSEIYGVWTQIIITLYLIAPVLNLQLGNAVVRFLAGEEDKDRRLKLLGSMLAAILIFSCSALPLLSVFSVRFSVMIFGSASYVNFIYLMFIWTFIEAMFYFLASYFQARRRIKMIAIIQTSFLMLRMTAIVVLAPTGFSLETLVACIVAIEAAFTLLVFGLIVREDGWPKLGLTGIKELLSFSLPQIPTQLLTWIMNSIDRYFIIFFIGLSFAGIYASSFTLGGTISLFYAPINYVLLPNISRAWEDHRRETVQSYFEYSLKLFLTLAIPAAAGLAILSQPLLKTLATPTYQAGWGIVLIIALTTVLYGIYSINVFSLFLIKKIRRLPVIFGATSLISVTLNFLLIPVIGISGAALSRMVAYLILATVVLVWSKKSIDYRLDFVYYLKIILATAAMSLFLYFVKPVDIPNIIFVALCGLLIFGLFLLLFQTFGERDRGLIFEIFFKGSRFWIKKDS